MIRSITLRNFQGHRRLTLDLDPRITTIVGPSDAGKSAVVRAVRWVLTNRPGGDAFVRDGASKASASLEVCDHEIGIVTRTRGRGVNTYAMTDVGDVEGDTQTFEAFGSEVPPLVRTFLNLAPINVQSQHDAPFWFGDTPGEVSRQLNEIVDLGVIDSTLAHLASEIRTSAQAVTWGEARTHEARERLRASKPAREMAARLGEVEGLAERAGELRLAASELDQLLRDDAYYRASLETAAKHQTAGDLALKTGEAWAALQQQAEALGETLTAMEQQHADIEAADREIEGLETTLREELKKGCPLCGKRTKS